MGRERLNSSGEWKCYRISCRSPECGRVGHAFPASGLCGHAIPLRSSPARDEGATGAFCSCGIYRNRTPDTPAFLPKRKSDHHSARGSVPTSYSKCPTGWTCGFARFRTWNAQWAFRSHTSAPERARCRSAKPRRQLRAKTQSKSKHSTSGPGGRAVPIDSARAGSHLMWLPCEPGLDRSGTACPHGLLRQFLTYPAPREERE